MRLLRPFRPRLIGSVMTGHVRKGSDIDLHVFSDSPGLVTDLLEQEGCQFDVERKQVVKHGESPRLHAHPRPRPLQLRADRLRRGQGPLRLQELDHRQGDRAGVDRASWRNCWPAEYPGPRPRRRDAAAAADDDVDPYPLFRMLLLPLENVQGSAALPSRGRRAVSFAAGVRAGPRRAGPTTRSSCWRRCCTTSARARPRATTSRPPWRRWTA